MKSQGFVQLQFDFEAMPSQENKPVLTTKPKGKNSKRAEDKFVFEFMDMLTAPMITFSLAWVDAIPQKLKENIRVARIIGAMKKEETATIPEVTAYIMTRAYESPMSPEWVNIHLWCSRRYLREYENRDVPEDIMMETLTDNEKRLLKGLRSWIYRKRREYVKSQIKQTKD